MNELAIVQKVWNYAHVLRDQGVPYQAYISQISYLLLLKMDNGRAGLAAYGIKSGSAIPEDCRWPVLRAPHSRPQVSEGKKEADTLTGVGLVRRL
ncbi:MAG: hypothetical protein JO358_01510 [Alphaproteobacteria bacterium]|nr:hypothetical protein [Alphaproteobacteria bacterium]